LLCRRRSRAAKIKPDSVKGTTSPEEDVNRIMAITLQYPTLPRESIAVVAFIAIMR
jgi:hypothetical protein